MARMKDLTGETFGRLTVLGLDEEKTKEYREETGVNRVFWKCECNCKAHTIISVYSSNLINKNTKSCGCLRREVSRNKRLKQIS